jgi:hypothetical protein
VTTTTAPGQAVKSAKIWILAPRDDLPSDDDPWEPRFDKCFGLIVEAGTEDEARAIANTSCVCSDETTLRDRRVFLDPKYTTCVELRPIGKSRLVMADFKPA